MKKISYLFIVFMMIQFVSAQIPEYESPIAWLDLCLSNDRTIEMQNEKVVIDDKTTVLPFVYVDGLRAFVGQRFKKKPTIGDLYKIYDITSGQMIEQHFNSEDERALNEIGFVLSRPYSYVEESGDAEKYFCLPGFRLFKKEQKNGWFGKYWDEWEALRDSEALDPDNIASWATVDALGEITEMATMALSDDPTNYPHFQYDPVLSFKKGEAVGDLLRKPRRSSDDQEVFEPDLPDGFFPDNESVLSEGSSVTEEVGSASVHEAASLLGVSIGDSTASVAQPEADASTESVADAERKDDVVSLYTSYDNNVATRNPKKFIAGLVALLVLADQGQAWWRKKDSYLYRMIKRIYGAIMNDIDKQFPFEESSRPSSSE